MLYCREIFDNILDPIDKCLSKSVLFALSMRAIGPILVLLLSFVICFSSWTFFVYILPNACENYIYRFIHISLASFFVFNVFFNYFLSIFTNPNGSSEILLSLIQHELYLELGYSRFCKKCKKKKLPRTHHCNICGKCILQQDHHCPWTMNCIGLYNRRYFVLFLSYLWLSCLYYSILSWISISNQKEPMLTYISILFALSLIFSISLLLLVVWQYYLVLTGQTQSEFLENQALKVQLTSEGKEFPNENELGLRENFEKFFQTGKSWWKFFYPSFGELIKRDHT